MSTTPPGWYDDGHGALRWWDGAQWTEHVAQPDPEPEPGVEVPATATGETSVLPPELAADLDPAAAMSAGVPAPAEVPDYSAYGAAGAQPPYAGAYGESPSGAFMSATEAKKSRGWIIWVVVGVALLGIVIAAAVLIPLLLLGASTGTTGGGQGPTDSSTVVIDDTADVSGDDELAALDAVTLYDAAWQSADCDSYLAATTEDFRATLGYTDCDLFVEDATSFSTTTDDYVVHVVDVFDEGDEVAVTTTETYTSMYDADGRLTDSRESYEDRYQYWVVAVDGGWAIDDIVNE